MYNTNYIPPHPCIPGNRGVTMIFPSPWHLFSPCHTPWLPCYNLPHWSDTCKAHGAGRPAQPDNMKRAADANVTTATPTTATPTTDPPTTTVRTQATA